MMTARQAAVAYTHEDMPGWVVDTVERAIKLDREARDHAAAQGEAGRCDAHAGVLSWREEEK